MLWIIVFATMIVLFAIEGFIRNKGWVSRVDSTVMGGFLGGFFGLIISGIGMLSGVIFVGEHWKTYRVAELANLQDNGRTSGSFFLGSGSIDEEPVFWYYENNSGVLSLHHVGANVASLVEADGPPRLEVLEKKSDNTWFQFHSGSKHYRFYVPPGSVVNNFRLDAEPK